MQGNRVLAMINRDRTDLSLTKQCKLLKISRRSLYCVPVCVNAGALRLTNEIDRVFAKYPFFGSPQIAAYLPKKGSMQPVTVYAVRWVSWGCKRSTKARIPAKNTHRIAFTYTY
jgi:hypothetical protein